MLRIWMLFLLFFIGACQSQTSRETVFVENKQSKFEICIPPNASPRLVESVEELQLYIKKIAGVKLPITTERKANHQIVIGDKLYMKSDKVELPFQKLKVDGLVIKIQNDRILISGLNEKGVINGIYTFLSEYLGCRYYARDAIYVPKKEDISFQLITDVQNPAFDMRIMNAYQAFSPTYCKWHKLDFPPKTNPLWLKPWAHATTRYIKLKENKNTHPEYFTYIAGKPIDINYDNQEVFQIIIRELEEKLQKNPQAEYISVSQADIKHNLKEVKNEMNSFITLKFTNKVAKKFPKKTVTYLAYQYSMMPPEGIKPLDNVLVVITNTLPDRNKATNLKSPQNQFAIALRGWQRLTDNIMIWDYFGNMSYPGTPYPNLFLMQKNLKEYEEMGIDRIFAQSNNQRGSEFQELRSYLLAKLLWNPNLNVDSLMTDFINGYYGNAAPYITEYIYKMTKNFEVSKRPLRRNVGPVFYKKSYLSPKLLKEYDELFDQAEKAVQSNTEVLLRVDKLRQSLRYAKLEIYRSIYFKNKPQGLKRSKNKPQSLNRSKNKAIMTVQEYNELLETYINKSEDYGLYKISNKAQSSKVFKKVMKVHID